MLSHHLGMEMEMEMGRDNHREGAQTVDLRPRPSGGPAPASIPVSHRELDPWPSHQTNLGRSEINVAGGCISRDTGPDKLACLEPVVCFSSRGPLPGSPTKC